MTRPTTMIVRVCAAQQPASPRGLVFVVSTTRRVPELGKKASADVSFVGSVFRVGTGQCRMNTSSATTTTPTTTTSTTASSGKTSLGKSWKDGLSPHMIRELERHVAPSSSTTTTTKNPHSATTTTTTTTQSEQARRQQRTLGWTIAFTLTAASFPILAYLWIGNLNFRDDALTAPQVRRGAFQNSGSRDVGRDFDYDTTTGKHKHQQGYGDNADTTTSSSSRSRGIRGEYLAAPASQMKKYEQELEAAAKGQGPPATQSK